MSTPTYKLVRTVINIEQVENVGNFQRPTQEVVETGLSWADAKKRTRGADNGLKAVREVEAAPTTI